MLNLLKLSAIFVCLTFYFNYVYCTWPEFYYYSRDNVDNFVYIPSNLLISVNLTITRKNYFIVHGFESNGNVKWAIEMKNSILIHENANVFIVDWRKGAKSPYLKAVYHVEKCGNSIAAFIKDSGMRPTVIHCIGHSLGAHVCSYCGKSIKLGRITGLDPAGPVFNDLSANKRLSITDADYVDVIHGSKALGLQKPIGHKDFYPNGGEHQPGCPPTKDAIIDPDHADEIVSCSHKRVPYLFVESILSNCSFTSVKCDNYYEYVNKECYCNVEFGCASMGFYSDRTNETGKFYLNTNSDSPYCIN